MSSAKTPVTEPTAVDAVRQVREKIAREHAGDLRKHVEETTRIGEEVRAKLNVRLVTTWDRTRAASVTKG